jgi:hypothetical protein
MTTNVQIIEDSLRMLGVIAETQAASAEQGTNALRKLNGIMEAWAVENIELGYFAQTSTADTCPIPSWAERGVASKLANALLADYPSALIAPDMTDDEKNGIGTIRRIVHYQNREPLDMTHLGCGEGQRTFIDITQ